MGQTSLPLKNRSGVFSYWDKSWDSKYQYAYYNTKFSYLDDLFYYFFQNKVFLNNFKGFKKSQKLPNHCSKGYLLKSNINVLNKNINSFYFCSSKIWVFKYNSWILVSVYLYDLGLKQLKKKKTRNVDLGLRKNSNLPPLNDISKTKKSKKSITLKSLRKLRTFLSCKEGVGLGSPITKPLTHLKTTNRLKIFKSFFKKKKIKKKNIDLSYTTHKKFNKEISQLYSKLNVLNFKEVHTNLIQNSTYKNF